MTKLAKETCLTSCGGD